MNPIFKVLPLTALVAACGGQVTTGDQGAGGTGGGATSTSTSTSSTTTAAGGSGQGGGSSTGGSAEEYCLGFCEDVLLAADTSPNCGAVKNCENKNALTICTKEYTGAEEKGCLEEFLALWECAREEIATVPQGCAVTCEDEHYALIVCTD